MADVSSVVSWLCKPIFPQYFARSRQRRLRRQRQFPIRPVTPLAGCVNAKLADGTVLFERLGTIGARAGNNDEIALRPGARRMGPFDLDGIPGIDVVID